MNVFIKGQHSYWNSNTDYGTSPKELMELFLSFVLLFSGLVGGASTCVREVETGEGWTSCRKPLIWLEHECGMTLTQGCHKF